MTIAARFCQTATMCVSRSGVHVGIPVMSFGRLLNEDEAKTQGYYGIIGYTESGPSDTRLRLPRRVCVMCVHVSCPQLQIVQSVRGVRTHRTSYARRNTFLTLARLAARISSSASVCIAPLRVGRSVALAAAACLRDDASQLVLAAQSTPTKHTPRGVPARATTSAVASDNRVELMAKCVRKR